MGFECGFYRMPRYKNTSGNQVMLIEQYNNWYKNYSKNYNFKSFSGHDESELPDNDTITYYSQFIHKGNYGEDCIADLIEHWCSTGRLFNDWFIHKCNNGIDDCQMHNELTKELIEEAIEYTKEYLERSKLLEWKVVRAFKKNDKTGEIVAIPCDGIELENEDGLIKRIETEYDTIYYGLDRDSDKYNTFEQLNKALNNMLTTTDFKKQMIYYCTSW